MIEKKYSNRETYNELSQYIDDMNITKTEYDIILNLLQKCDNKLFVKILEEIYNGNMTWLDFKQVFDINQNQFEKSIENQEDLYRQISLINQINIATDFKNLFTLYKDYSGTNQEDAVKVERENQILSMITEKTGDTLTDLYNTEMAQRILNSEDSDFIDSMLLSAHDYVVPVDYDHIQLNRFDLEFASKNKLSIDSMKKIKSLAAFFSNYYDTTE